MADWRDDVRTRLDGLAIDPAREIEIVEELSVHLEARYRQLRSEGLDETGARAAALAELDDAGLRHRLGALRRPSSVLPPAGGPDGRMLAGIWRDARLAVRMLLARPGFSAVAVLTLALGLGANTAIFSVVHAVLLEPLPFHQPDRLVFVWGTSPERPIENLTPGRLVDFRTRLTSMQAVAGISHLSLNLTGRGAPQRLGAASVSPNFFEVLGVRAETGRTFDPAGADGPSVVLTHALWRGTFNADPSIVGSALTLNGTSHTVLGVMPPAFIWPIVATRPAGGPGPDIFVAAKRHGIPDMPVDRGDDLRLNRRTGYLRALARLKDGVSLDAAQAEAVAVAQAIERDHPVTDAQRGATLVQVRDHLVGPTTRPLMLMLGAVAFVLLIACANVANLVMGRAASRRREFEVRLALGASRRRLMQQLLVESGVLALAGAAAGVLLAWWSLGALVSVVPDGILRIDAASLSLPVLAFSLVLACLTAGIFGIIPALQAGRLERQSGLRADSRTIGGSRRGARSLIVAAEVAVAVTLVVGAALLVRSFVALQRVEVGIETSRLLTFDLVLSGERAEYQAQQVAFYERVLDRVRALPGVAAAGMAVTLPIGGDDFGAPVTIDGRPVPAAGQETTAGMQMVSPGYFDAAGMQLLAGRDVALTDTRAGRPVAVVNETFARQHWPGERALGRRFWIGRNQTAPPIEVVGIVEDIRHYGPKAPPRPEFYQPYSQSSFSFMAVLVRTHGDPAMLAGPVRQAILDLDPSQPISRLMTMEEHLRDSLAQPRFLSAAAGLFGGLALVLSAIGIYGVMAWSVAARTQEFGVRLALGAKPARLLLQVMLEGLLVVGAGAAAGLALSIALSQGIASFLFETRPLEPGAYAIAVAVVFAAATAALVVPALRATRVDPLLALRSQ